MVKFQIGKHENSLERMVIWSNVMTRYLYSNQTFRLLRQKSEKYTYSQVDNTLTYTPDAGTKRKDDGFNFDLVGIS